MIAKAASEARGMVAMEDFKPNGEIPNIRRHFEVGRLSLEAFTEHEGGEL